MTPDRFLKSQQKADIARNQERPFHPFIHGKFYLPALSGPRLVSCRGTEEDLQMSNHLSCRIWAESIMKNGNGGRGLVREERLQIMLSPDELKAVDSFRFVHRMPSRAAAVRELLRHGLDSIGAVIENVGVKSRDYGVLKAPKALLPTNKARQPS